MRNIILIAKREYIKIVRQPSFWISTFLFPVFMAIVSFVSGYSAEVAEEKIQEQIANVEKILIIDEGNLINETLIVAPYEKVTGESEALELVKTGKADALFVYPTNAVESGTVNVYALDTGIATRSRFDGVAKTLAHQSLLLTIDDPTIINRINTGFSAQTTVYKDGEPVVFSLEELIVPIVSVILYFFLVFLATNFLLLSVSEEKESRMIEIMLSIVTSRELIWGKILGLSGVVLTQLSVLAGAGIFLLRSTIDQLPVTIDFSSVSLDPVQLLFSGFCLICGFLMMASIMVGVGAVMPTYKEAQSFSSVFVIAAISPVYFAVLIVQDPSGTIAQIASYFPFTSPLILLSRNALNALTTTEMIIGSLALLSYVMISLILAFKLFEIGSLEYTNKLSLKRLIKN